MSGSATPVVRLLAEVADLERAEVGGKAQSLGVLAAAGFAVPPGFALTTAGLETYVDLAGLSERRAALEVPLAQGELPTEEALAAFRSAVTAAPFPAGLRTEVQAALQRAFPNPEVAVAVRSSGTREDLEGASFAGQYETFLNVRGLDEVCVAIQRCWASLWQFRVLDYALNHGGATGLTMCVVVQQMVEADVAGVLFTVNPVTGRENEVLIESVFGLGESLVSGRVTADQFVVDALSGEVLSENLAKQAFKIVSTDQGTEEIELDGAAAGERTLDAARLRELSELSGAIQEHYGRPMDVEWAYLNGALAVLQARPVTKLSFAPDIGEWTTADFRDGGVSSDVCTPFMWSLYDNALENSMPGYFKDIKLIPPDYQAQWGRMFFARPYWNLGEVKKALLPIPGFSEAAFHADLGVAVEAGFEGRTTPTTAMGILRALPTLFALNRNYRERLASDAAFVAAFDERKAPFDLKPDEVGALERPTFVRRFEDLVAGLHRDTEVSYFSTIYNTSNSKLDLKPVFDKVNAAVGGDLDEPSLLSGLTDLSHLRPVKDMGRLAARLAEEGRPLDDDEVAAFAWKWRHHGRKELDIRTPRWVDDHEFVRAMLQSAIDAYDPAHDPEKLEAQHHQRYRAMRDRAMATLWWRPFLRRSFLKKLELVRQYAWWREEMRDYSSFVYYLVRLWAVDAGRRLAEEDVFAEADDVWFLPFQGVIGALKGDLPGHEVRQGVARGRRLVRSFREFDNPNEIGSHFRFQGVHVAASGDAHTGTPCSAGRVTARACVVKTLEDASRLEAGDVLVTIFTDPGWTPLFARIAGVVTETGGVLSHAAVIAREYGIPAVLAVPGATDAIRDGDTIVLDGVQGTVEIVERA